MMVTPYDETRLFVTLQTDHSRVAGFLASHWGNDVFATPKPWETVVLAAQEHDRGWWLWECRPTLSDAGGPLDYQNDTLHHLGELRTTIYRNAVSDIAPIDPYAALLILEHLTGLLTAGNGAYSFRKDLSDNPIAKSYLQNQSEVKQTLIEKIRRSPESKDHSADAQIEDNAKLVEVFDGLAQFLCNRYPLNSKNRGKDPNRIFAEFPIPTRQGEATILIVPKDNLPPDEVVGSIRKILERHLPVLPIVSLIDERELRRMEEEEMHRTNGVKVPRIFPC